MPKVINEDIIAKIAEYAGRNYSKSAVAKELGLDRTTVRKYWPKEQGTEEKKVEQPMVQLSLVEEFRLLNKKVGTAHELESLSKKIKDLKWETESLSARGKAAAAGIDFLKGKLEKAESVVEVDKICILVDEVRNTVTALLAENEPLRKQRQEQEAKKEESLRRLRLNELAWLFPCSRDQAEKIVERLVSNDVHSDDRIDALHRVGSLLTVAEELEWGDNTSGLKPLITECTNLLQGNEEEVQRIISILYERKVQILIRGDKDMEQKYSDVTDLLVGEIDARSTEIILKFNAALGRLAEERYLDKEKILGQENACQMNFGLARLAARFPTRKDLGLAKLATRSPTTPKSPACQRRSTSVRNGRSATTSKNTPRNAGSRYKGEVNRQSQLTPLAGQH